jgi:hypothetical protein
MVRRQALSAVLRELRVLAAGVGAGIVAALGSVAVLLATGARTPGPQETAWSAFAAAVAGGALYAVLLRAARRPAVVLWMLSLGIATLDSAMIAFLPMPAGRGPHLAVPVDGLLVPLRQLAALAGAGAFGARRFPARDLAADTVIHFIPAIAAAALVPWWSGRHGRGDLHDRGGMQETQHSQGSRGTQAAATR